MRMKQVHIRHYTNGFQRQERGKREEQSIAFNVVAGTSIGAMNAVLTSYVVENNTYEG